MSEYKRSTITIEKLSDEQNNKLKRAYRVWKNITDKDLTYREWKLFILEKACDGILSVTDESKRDTANYFFAPLGS